MHYFIHQRHEKTNYEKNILIKNNYKILNIYHRLKKYRNHKENNLKIV